MTTREAPLVRQQCRDEAHSSFGGRAERTVPGASTANRVKTLLSCTRGVALAAVCLGLYACSHGSAGGRATVGDDVASVAPTSAPVGSLIVGVSYQPSDRVTVSDINLRWPVGDVAVGYTPWVLLRPSRQEVLVSEAFDRDSSTPSLDVYRLHDLQHPTRVIDMPARASQIPVTYFRGMALSGDERLLFYGQVRSQCPEGGDAEACDVTSLGIIDLDAGRLVAEAPLGVGCGLAAPHPVGDRDAMVMCASGGTDAVISRVSADGGVTRVATFPERRTDSQTLGPDEFGFARDGAYYVVYRDGLVATSDGRTLGPLVPPDKLVGLDTFAPMQDGSTMVLFGDSRSHGAYNGVVIFRSDDPTQSRRSDLPFSVLDAAPLDNRRIALLKTEADNAETSSTIVLFDVYTAALTGDSYQLTVPAQWLLAR